MGIALLPYTFVALCNLALILWLGAEDPFDLQMWARVTAQIAALMLCCLFIYPVFVRYTGSSNRLRYIKRRTLGLAYAMAMLIHACALTIFHTVSNLPVETLTLMVGSGAYLILFFMVLTSFPRFRSRMSERAWRGMHRFGLTTFVMITGLTSFGGMIERGWFSISSIVLLFLLFGLLARISLQMRSSPR